MLASEQLDPIAIRTLLTTHGTHLDPESEEANLMQTQSTPPLPLSVAPEKRLAPIEFPISTAPSRRP
ncbi:hypothetical protein H4Q26_012669 [Puccinia striiformis f. sp. tritici PST-130]|nr:hypothetical protein H4Q26_012669 [Puccinia striiformis f. sp. tritici PST-130]